MSLTEADCSDHVAVTAKITILIKLKTDKLPEHLWMILRLKVEQNLPEILTDLYQTVYSGLIQICTNVNVCQCC